MEDLESRDLEFLTIRNFLTKLITEFDSGNNKLAKIAELKRVKQKSRMMEKFVQKFRRAIRESSFKE